VIKWFVICLGALFIFAGLVTFWLPLPVGIPLMLIGLPLVMNNSPMVREKLLHATRDYPKISKILRRISVKSDNSAG